MLIDVAENQTKARGRLESVTMVTMAGSSEESFAEDRGCRDFVQQLGAADGRLVRGCAQVAAIENSHIYY